VLGVCDCVGDGVIVRLPLCVGLCVCEGVRVGEGVAVPVWLKDCACDCVALDVSVELCDCVNDRVAACEPDAVREPVSVGVSEEDGVPDID
jgi:hypothetical protein